MRWEGGRSYREWERDGREGDGEGWREAMCVMYLMFVGMYVMCV